MENTDGELAQPELLTPRLRLRALSVDDAPAVQKLAGDPKISSVTETVPYPYENGVAQKWIATHPQHWINRVAVTYGVFDRSHTQLIGCTGLQLTAQHARASLGYWIGVDYWGQGYCTEASQRLIQFGFDELSLHRIEATHLLHNPASGRVMQKVGMTFEAQFTGYVKKDGVFVDVKQYSILRPTFYSKP